MTDWPCHVWLQRKLVWPTSKAALGGFYQLLCTNLDDGILCTLLPNHNIHRGNGVYQQWARYVLKSKSVSEIHFPAIWTSKFTEVNLPGYKPDTIWIILWNLLTFQCDVGCVPLSVFLLHAKKGIYNLCMNRAWLDCELLDCISWSRTTRP